MIPLLVPRRPDHGERDTLWRYCTRYWAARAAELNLQPVEGLHLDGPFNRGSAINAAAAIAGDWAVAVVADGDVVCAPEQLVDAIANTVATGRATFPFDTYLGLDATMTARVLDGYEGDWSAGVRFRMATHVSSLIVVPRHLWDAVGGFDHRIVGWGHDDVAFYAMLREVGGGVDRIPGPVWHLEHTWSAERDKRSPLFKAGEALANRYGRVRGAGPMLDLCAERGLGESAVLVVMTDGRRECIDRCVESLELLEGMPITRRIISDDSGDRDYEAWLRVRFGPHWDVMPAPRGRRTGFGHAVARARGHALESGQRWVFWTEDDFELLRPVPLGAMAQALRDRPHLAQMALQRQAWFPREREHGGVMAEWAHRGATWEELGCDWDIAEGFGGEHRWLEHDLFWTTNPHLLDRANIAEHRWPTVAHSESVFTRQVLKAGRRFGYWGAADEQWVAHEGERIGTHY